MIPDSEVPIPVAVVDQWRTFFEHAADPCFVLAVQPDGSLLLAAVNVAWERSTGRTGAQALGQSPVVALPPEAAAMALARLREAVASCEVRTYEDELHFPSGKRWWRTELRPVRGQDGSVVALACLARDLTEVRIRTRAEADLAESEARYRRLAENAPDVIYRIRFDPEPRVEYLSRAVEALTGYGPDEHYANPRLFLEILHPEDRALAHERLLGGKYDGTPIVVRVITKGGEIRFAEPRSAALRDEEGRLLGVEGVIRDVTERHRVQEERAALERRLQEAQRLESLGVLAGGIAHDFNNILTGILGASSVLRRGLGAGDSRIADVELVEHAAQRAADLCRQMLAYSGKGRFVVGPVNLGALVKDSLPLIELSISKRITLRLEAAANLPAVNADATQLRQVIMNLVMNASEAIGDRDGVIRVATGVVDADVTLLRQFNGAEALPAGRYVVVEVADTGVGMSPETQARIFDPFFTTKFTGRGLGLSAVLGIMRSHRSAIGVTSEIGKGTTFRLLFPASEAVAGEEAPPPPTTPSGTHKGLVLVVDDEEIVRKSIALILNGHGFEILEAADGRAGLEVFSRHAAEIVAVLMDLTMPQLDGVAAARELQRLRPDAPVLLMSGYSEQEALIRSQGANVAGFLAKPFGADDLLAKLTALLSTRARV